MARRRTRPPVRRSPWQQVGPVLPSEGGFTQARRFVPPPPKPHLDQGFEQLPAFQFRTGSAPPPVTAMPERPIPDPATGQPFADQRTAGAYIQPHEAEQQRLDAGQTHQQVREAAVQYAQQRLSSLRQIATLAGDEQLSMILASNGDPLQVYAAASRRWAQLAHDAGYADPRIWLRDMVAAARTHSPRVPQPV